MKTLGWLSVVILLLSGCSGASEDELNNDETGLTDTLRQEYAIYTIPSPLYIGSVLKQLDCGYSTASTGYTRGLDVSGTGTTMKNAMLLGLFIADFGYAFVSDEQGDMNIFLSKIEETVKVLDIQNPMIPGIMDRMRNNLHNKDSVSILINELQGKISKHYLANHKDAVSVYVLTGMLIEGLYLSLNTCDTQSKKSMSIFVNEFNQVMLQQKAYMINLSNMLNDCGSFTSPDLIIHMDKLNSAYKDLRISYSTDVKKNKISWVHLDRTKLPALMEEVKSFREWIGEN
jgi:hypothetical protein